jgi:hypothetical protein
MKQEILFHQGRRWLRSERCRPVGERVGEDGDKVSCRVLQEAAGEKKVGLDLDLSLRTAGNREYTGTLSLHMVLGFRHSIELAYRTLKLLKSLFQIHPFWSSFINNPGALMDCFNAFIFY